MRPLAAPLALLGSLLLPACERPLPPAMARASAMPQGEAGSSQIVFVRPVSPCDAGDYSTIVDAAGHFVGQLAPGTRFAASVAPGPHVFYAWDSIDLRFEGEAEYFNP